MSEHGKKTKTPPAKPRTPTWTQDPAPHDYPAAGSFLELIVEHSAAEVLTALLSQAPIVHHFAKDILRAAALPLLPLTDPEVAKDLAKLDAGTSWSPILLIRGDLGSGRPVIIADGYHRACASYHLGEDTPIPCRIAAIPTVSL